jgi:hypothetical protein
MKSRATSANVSLKVCAAGVRRSSRRWVIRIPRDGAPSSGMRLRSVSRPRVRSRPRHPSSRPPKRQPRSATACSSCNPPEPSRTCSRSSRPCACQGRRSTTSPTPPNGSSRLAGDVCACPVERYPRFRTSNGVRVSIQFPSQVNSLVSCPSYSSHRTLLFSSSHHRHLHPPTTAATLANGLVTFARVPLLPASCGSKAPRDDAGCAAVSSEQSGSARRRPRLFSSLARSAAGHAFGRILC